MSRPAPRFSSFAAIDWSGAKDPASYRGKVQVAIADADGPPRLLMQAWTRSDVRNWLLDVAHTGEPMLIGMDFSFAPPFLDRGAYFPGEASADHAKALWAYVEAVCDGAADLWPGPLLERHRQHFYLGKADGAKAPYMRLRRCELAFNAAGGGKPSSVFDAIGAAQVSKASFAGMRLLHAIAPQLPVWPFDPIPSAGPLLVEIYCRAFLRRAGGRGLKLRDRDALNIALAGLGSPPVTLSHPLSDDMTDVLVAAAGLRAAQAEPDLWQPAGLDSITARTEGWTYTVTSAKSA
jgi:hypothetical protein